MRFVIATVLLTASALSVLLGFVLKGPWAANAGHRIEFKVDSAYSYLVIPHDTLTKFDGDVSIQASGTQKIFYADGRERDIQDWIGTSNFVRLNVNPSTNKPDISPVTAGGIDTNPTGSDLWRSQLNVKNNLLTTVSMYDDTAVLLASDGLHRGPTNVTVIWQSANLINWPLLLIYGGAVLLVLALIMNYIAFRHIRKLRGPRRRIPKAPKGPKYRRRVRPDVPRKGRRSSRRRMMVAPVALISLSLLAGCSSAAPAQNATDKPKFEQVSVVVTDSQLQRIVGEVASTVNLADKTRDEKALLTRVSGTALDIRKVQYLLQIKSKKIPKLPELVANPVTVALPMQLPVESQVWQPRTIMVVTKSDSTNRAPQLMVLQQATPRENYKLWYLIDLLPTAKFPKVAAQDTGALAVDLDNAYLATTLKSLPFKYGDTINKGLDSKFATEFDLASDKFYAALSESQTQQTADLKKANATIKFLHSLGNPNSIGMLTVESGGLVAISMDDTSLIRPKIRGVAVSVTQLDHKILLDAPGSATGLKIVYGNMLLFYVPVAGSEEQIRLVGASQGILSVKALN
jgi:hypothetical protein